MHRAQAYYMAETLWLLVSQTTDMASPTLVRVARTL